MSGEFDPDRPVPGDPPFDAISMLEVAEEARLQAIQQRQAAVKMMVPFAIRAILDGIDPLEVATKCGFLTNVQHEEDPSMAIVNLATGMIMGHAPAAHSDDAAVAKFTGWLLQEMEGLIKEAYLARQR